MPTNDKNEGFSPDISEPDDPLPFTPQKPETPERDFFAREGAHGPGNDRLMPRRYFEHLYIEICVAVGRRISRYDLWLLMWDNGGDPDELTRTQARHFVENNLSALLIEQSCVLSSRARKRLERRILRFDPDHPTPEEWLGSLCQQFQEAA